MTTAVAKTFDSLPALTPARISARHSKCSEPTRTEIPEDIRVTAMDVLHDVENASCEEFLFIADALLAERERCAKIAEGHINPLGTRSWDGDDIAAAIRAA